MIPTAIDAIKGSLVWKVKELESLESLFNTELLNFITFKLVTNVNIFEKRHEAISIIGIKILDAHNRKLTGN